MNYVNGNSQKPRRLTLYTNDLMVSLVIFEISLKCLGVALGKCTSYSAQPVSNTIHVFY